MDGRVLKGAFRAVLPVIAAAVLAAGVAVAAGPQARGLTEKSVEPSVDKQVKGASGTWRSCDEAGSGQEVRYRIVATLPSNADAYERLPFEVADEFGAGLLVDAGSVRVCVRDAGTGAGADTGTGTGTGEREVTTSCGVELGDGRLTVDVGKGDALRVVGAPAGEAVVTVSYTARLADAALAGARRGNLNTAHVRYLACPNGEEMASTETVAARLLTWKVRVAKSGSGRALRGARFELRDSRGGLVGAVTTGEDGTAAFPGICSGSYTLAETAAPRGYLRAGETRLALRADLGSDGDGATLQASSDGAGAVVSCDAQAGVVTVAVEDEPEAAAGALEPPRTGDGTPVALACAALACVLGVGCLARAAGGRHAGRRRQ